PLPCCAFLSAIAACGEVLGIPSALVQRNRKCFSAITETMGRSFYEAVACGTRVVGTAVGGLPALISEWNGALVAPEDSHSAAHELVRQAGLGRIPREQVRRFRSRFSWRAVFSTYRRWFGL